MITAHQSPDRLMITIQDDGQGFDLDQKSGGAGLLGIRERARNWAAAAKFARSPPKARWCISTSPSRRFARVPKTSILLADDHAIVRTGLRYLLEQDQEYEVVAEADDGREAARLAADLKPDVAVLDIAMPTLNGSKPPH